MSESLADGPAHPTITSAANPYIKRVRSLRQHGQRAALHRFVVEGILPVWRALGNTVQTDLDGFAYIFNRDFTAVFVDARTPEVFRADTVACAVNVQKDEADAANTDGRLPLLDKGARVVVFADDPQLARTVAAQIAKKAYWSSSYFSGTFDDLKNSRQMRIHSERRCHVSEAQHTEPEHDDD